MAAVQLSGSLIDAGYVIGQIDQIWHRCINRTLRPYTQSVSMPPGAYWDWTWEFDCGCGFDPLVSGQITISPSGIVVPVQTVQPNFFTIWVSGGVSGVTYQMTYWVERESGEQESNSTWLSIFGTLPPPIQ